MGKYLDIARKFEEQRKAERQTDVQPPHSLRDRYHRMAESVAEDCDVIDAVWLLEKHPYLWQRMAAIDHQLTKLEQRNADPGEYDAMLERLIKAVKDARALYEKERQTIQQEQ